jgi:uncharacterized membrane protein YfcA
MTSDATQLSTPNAATGTLCAATAAYHPPLTAGHPSLTAGHDRSRSLWPQPRKIGQAAIGVTLLAAYAQVLTMLHLHSAVAPALAITVSSGISSLVGFAFAPISQAVMAPLMHDPVKLVQILMVCSIATQSFAIVSLWRHMDWKRLPVYLAGGALGLPIGVYLLLHLGIVSFHAVIGLLLVVYGAYVLLKRPFVVKWGGWPAELFVGFLGGITGGLAAFPGAAITVWCSLKGWDKARQRGVFQPFILAMQFMALGTIALMRTHTSHTGGTISAMVANAIIFVPPSLLGSWFGLKVFSAVSDQSFRRCLGALLALSGLLMMV